MSWNNQFRFHKHLFFRAHSIVWIKMILFVSNFKIFFYIAYEIYLDAFFMIEERIFFVYVQCKENLNWILSIHKEEAIQINVNEKKAFLFVKTIREIIGIVTLGNIISNSNHLTYQNYALSYPVDMNRLINLKVKIE